VPAPSPVPYSAGVGEVTGSPVPGYSQFPLDSVTGAPTPVSSFFVFTTEKNPFDPETPLVPLYRLSFAEPSSATCDRRSHVYTTDDDGGIGSLQYYTSPTSGFDLCPGAGNPGNQVFRLDAIEGYVLPACPEGSEFTCDDPFDPLEPQCLYRFRKGVAGKQWALVLERERNLPPYVGYNVAEGEDCIGYVFTHDDTDGDDLIDGAELTLGTDPFSSRSDADDLRDGKEVLVDELLCDVLRFDLFDGGPVDRWDSLVESGAGALSLQPATIGGGIWIGENRVAGVAGDQAYLVDATPDREQEYRARFWIDASSLAMSNGEEWMALLARDQALAQNAFYLTIRRQASKLFVRGYARDDQGSLLVTTDVPLGDAVALIAVEWWATGARDAPFGGLRLRTSARPAAPILRLDNSQLRVDNAALGMRLGVDPGTSGDVRFEEFLSCRN